MTRRAVGEIGLVLWCLAVATAFLEGWTLSYLVVGVGLGWYFRSVEVRAAAEIRRRDGSVRRREWGSGR